MHVVEKEFKNFVSQLNYDHYFIAYSGGVDSQVLLNLAAKYLPNKVTALHVNHGISSNAFYWENVCREMTEKLGVSFDVARFNLKEQGSNLEEVARKLRYNFFEEKMTENDVILTGHHLDDQAETFMLRLMRGSGVDGLASMSPIRPLANGDLARPLLNVTKEEIYDFAIKTKLTWVEDESNKTSDYDRNFIRNEVLPLLKTRWEKANHSIARSAKHCEVVKQSMQEEDQDLFKQVSSENKINTIDLKALKRDKQKRVIRFWLKENGALMPSEKNLDVILDEVAYSRSDSSSCYKTKNYELRKSFDELYFVNPQEKPEFDCPENCKVIVNPQSLKMNYKGTVRSFKYIMKAEKIPYWLRDSYYAMVNKDNIVVAFGDIESN